MPEGLSFQRFQAASQCRDEAMLVVSELGELAPWIVQLPVRQRAAEHTHDPHLAQPPVPRPGAGMCQIVLALDPAIATRSIMNEGFLLPLHWRQGGRHDDRLPLPLRQTADTVLQVLELSGYSLHLMHPDHRRGPQGPLWPDLTGDQLQFSSAFASLASALLMLEHQLHAPAEARRLDHLTVATGSWQEGTGISAVGGIPLKTRAVAAHPRGGEPCVRHWFVPAQNQPEAAQTLSELHSDLALHSFPVGEANPRRALARLLALSGVRPQADGGLHDLIAYHQFLRRLDPQEANDYYQHDIYPQVVRRCIADHVAFQSRPTSLISVVSSPAVIGIAVELFQLDDILLLHTQGDPGDEETGTQVSEFARRAAEAEGIARQAGATHAMPRGFVFRPQLSGDALRSSVVQAMEHAVRDFLDQHPPGQIIWDMTSGLRIFTLVIDKCLARPGDWMLYFSHVWSQRHDHRIPLTESVVLWQHGTAWK